MSWWVIWSYEDGGVVLVASWAFWVILSITLHELGHGYAALWQGDETPRRLGHMTMNPVVHMGVQSLLVFVFLGIAWGAMPVDPAKFRWRRRGRVVVALAGPAVNLAVALACTVLAAAWIALGPAAHNAYGNLAQFLYTGIWLNLMLAGLNLLPLPPLDGSQVLAGLSLRMYQLYHHPNAPLIGLFMLVVIFFATPIGGLAWAVCRLVAMVAVDAAGTPLGSPPLAEVLAG